MDERQLVPAVRVGLDDVGWADQAGARLPVLPGFAPSRSRRNEMVMDQAVFQGRENVRSDIDLVAR
jgi:hypothetical protein